MHLQIQKKTQNGTFLLMLLFNLTIVIAFVNWTRLNPTVLVNYLLLISIAIVSTVLFTKNKISLKTISRINYFFILPGIAGTIAQIML